MKFSIVKVYEPKTSIKGKLYSNCKTNNSILISFWGKHAREVQQQTVPFEVNCKVKETSAEVISKTKVRFWAIETMRSTLVLDQMDFDKHPF